MPVQRGAVYRAARDRDVDGWLVLTNDDWNQHLSEVGAVPLALVGALAPPPPHSPTIDVRGRQYAAVTGALASVDRELDLGDVIGVVHDADLGSVEAALVDLLDLRPLLTLPPTAPPLAPGPTAPLWGEVYFGPPRGKGSTRQRKRYVVVSNNHWNVSGVGQVMCVRTTTSERRGGAGFPEIQSGTARACVGTMAAVRVGALIARERPTPRRLVLQDMVIIARDVIGTFQLRL